MKHPGTLIFLSFVFLMNLIGCAGNNAPGISSPMHPSSSAPDFKLADLNGKTVSLSQYKGKVVLLDFWATWCPPCRREIPHLISLYNRYQNKGLVLVGVALDEEGEKVVRPFVEEFKINYPIVIGTPEVQKAYGGIQGIPTTFLIDKKGKIVTTMVGYQDISAVEKKIQPLL